MKKPPLLIFLILVIIPIVTAFTSDNDWRIIPNFLSFNQENTEFPANISGNANIINAESSLQGIARFWQRLAGDTVQPAPFNLSSPTNGSSSTDNTPLLAWANSSDINFENYTIEISETSDFSIINYTYYKYSNLNNTFSDWSPALSNGTWYWHVIAYDTYSNYRRSNQNFTFTVEQISETITTTTTITSHTPGGSKRQPFSLNIIAPPTVTIYSKDTITVPLIITNPSKEVVFNYINLSTYSDSKDITPSLTLENIPTLRPKEQRKFNLKLTTHTLPGTYGITITASVINPSFTDSVRIYANLIDENLGNRSTATKQLAFAKKFFEGNLECSDLQQYLKQAELSLQQEKFDQVINLASNAIQACKELIALKEKPTKKPYTPEIIIKNLLKNKNFPIIATEIIGAIIILSILSKFLKKRRKKIHPNL